jgi:CO dehydrogenase maturation factor
MKVAFVGKGGSGKSTFTTLFFLHLVKQNQTVMCFDADLNIHVPTLLGIHFPEHKSLSLTQNTKKIREFLIGTSTKIKSISHFYKTTPPSQGVNLFEIEENNYILKNYSEQYKQSFVSVVGTYEAEEIGKSCYHTNLAILENILSFSQLKKDQWIVADMVAGIDAFSNTLHQQFDALFLLVEPTQESISVYKQYTALAKNAGMNNRLFVIGNKIEDKDDETFITSHIPRECYIGFLKKNSELKKLRQNNTPLSETIFSIIDESLFQKAADIAKKLQVDPQDRLQKLHTLHRTYVEQAYVKRAVGDITGQIDNNFTF